MAETQAEMIRRLREQAWDEGYLACTDRLKHGKITTNPYRKRDHDGPTSR